jgi:hypothetical protein
MSFDIDAVAGLGWFDEIIEEGLLGKGSKFLSGNFHEAIFVKEDVPRKLGKPVSLAFSGNQTQQKIVNWAQRMPILDVQGGLEFGGIARWGGKDGPEYGGYAKGNVHDEKGKKIEVRVEQQHDGKGSLSVSGGYERPQKQPKKENK